MKSASPIRMKTILTCLVLAYSGLNTALAQDAKLADRVSALEKRLESLDARLARIENVLFATLKFSESEARKQLKEARAALAQSERLHAQGLISAVQLQLDRMSLDRAQTLLRMCVNHEDHRKIGATLEVLDAKRNFERLSLQLSRTEELFEKGFAAKGQIADDRTAVIVAGQKLKLAESKLKNLKESLEAERAEKKPQKERPQKAKSP